jgi:hypothetical protein
MAGADDTAAATWVLNTGVVRWGIEQLQNRPIHSFFTAYLLIRQQAAREQTSVVQPDWATFGTYFDVPGGPPGKATFRPFWDQARNAGQDWIKHHPAGSYNPSSVRANTPGRMVLGITEDNKSYILGDDHWRLARQYLLRDQRAPVIALCTFLYRNYGFQTNGVSPDPHGLVAIFREDFGYRPDDDDEEFEYLYDPSILERTDWFVPITADARKE